MKNKLHILIVASEYPAHDRASGDVRFYTLLKMLSEAHEIFFCATAQRQQVERLGADNAQRYESDLKKLNVNILQQGLANVLKEGNFDAVLFEFYYVAQAYLDDVRAFQPKARIIIDSVDISFHRLLSKAALTQSPHDLARALEEKKKEMSAYKKADIVIVVTESDQQVLLAEDAAIATVIIPNIHAIHGPITPTATNPQSLIFVGNFVHEPNVDAMLYFCGDIFPRIIQAVPGAYLKIIGNAPPEKIKALASGHIEVLGYVPETRPYLETSGISIAPLRFGGGMKGKIGEAMSFGLPVVTTTVGIEGFGLTPQENVVVADTAEDFSDAVIRLITDSEYYNRIRLGGFEFIKGHYSEEIVKTKVHYFLDRLKEYPIKGISFIQSTKKNVAYFMGKHVRWRLK